MLHYILFNVIDNKRCCQFSMRVAILAGKGRVKKILSHRPPKKEQKLFAQKQNVLFCVLGNIKSPVFFLNESCYFLQDVVAQNKSK